MLKYIVYKSFIRGETIMKKLKITIYTLLTCLILIMSCPISQFAKATTSINPNNISNNSIKNIYNTKKTPTIEQDKRNIISQNNKKPLKVLSKAPKVSNKVALSFDDGPYLHYTEEYLKILKANDVGATFFLVGDRIKAYPEAAKLIVKEGFEIGNHSFSHEDLSKKSIKELDTDIQLTNDKINKISNKNPIFLRPPYGFYNNDLLEVAKNNNLTVVTWSVDPKDWQGIAPNELIHKVVNNTTDGDIILLHEGNKNTLIALPYIIKGLQEKGYKIVSISELLEFQ